MNQSKTFQNLKYNTNFYFITGFKIPRRNTSDFLLFNCLIDNGHQKLSTNLQDGSALIYVMATKV